MNEASGTAREGERNEVDGEFV